jgi:hypothetical protein
MVLNFEVLGGRVTAEGIGYTTISQNGVTVTVESELYFEGVFEGGDGGKISGTWSGTSTMTLPDGEKVGSEASGTWIGNLYASGEGSGTWQGGTMAQDGWWSVTYSSSAFIAELPTVEGTATMPSSTSTGSSPTAVPSLAGATEVAPTGIVATEQALTSTPEGENQSRNEVPPEEIEAMIAAVQNAAEDPTAPLAGGTVGALLGGLLAYLTTRAGTAVETTQDLTQSARDALQDLSERGAITEERSGIGEIGLQHAESIQNIAQELSNVVEGMDLGERAVTIEPRLIGGSPMDSIMDAMEPITFSPSTTDQILRVLNIVDNVAQTRNIQIKELKHLGRAGLALGIKSRAEALLEKRGDESWLYKGLTIFEAVTLETAKFYATKNPFIAVLDNGIGMFTGKNPSDMVCDGISDLPEVTYQNYVDTQTYAGGKYGRKHDEDMREFFLQEVRNLKAQFERGEITKEDFQSRARGYRMDYTEYVERGIQAANWLRD